jgi:hypothetical protein
VGCGRAFPFPDPVLDMGEGGLICPACRPGADGLPVSGSLVGVLARLRASRWEEALRLPLAPALGGALTALVDGIVVRLTGQASRSSRFLLQTRRGLQASHGLPDGRRSAR